MSKENDALNEWHRRINMVQVATLEPDNQLRIHDLLTELKTLEGIFGEVFRLRLEGGYCIKLQIELSLTEGYSQQEQATPGSPADGKPG